ncbi:MAG: hypothetical protein ACTSV5_03765 [Promethearchaeota archaeon]
MLYVMFFFVALSYGIKFFNSVKFDYSYTNEMKAYDEEFFDYISQKQENE